MLKHKFKRGDQVIDLSGFKGTVVDVIEHEGSHWYDVRLPGGVGVRFENELRRGN